MKFTVKFNSLSLALILMLSIPLKAMPQTAGATETPAEPTMIQLKTMQERKFLKPYEDMLDAISTSVGYSSGKCHTISEPSINARGRMVKGKVTCHYQPKVPEVRTGFGASSFLSFIPIVGAVASIAESGMMMADLQKQAEEARKQISSIDFELSFPKKNGKYKDDETILKMVMFQGGGRGGGTVVKLAEIYSENFKKLADALFIEALEISPAEQE